MFALQDQVNVTTQSTALLGSTNSKAELELVSLKAELESVCSERDDLLTEVS